MIESLRQKLNVVAACLFGATVVAVSYIPVVTAWVRLHHAGKLLVAGVFGWPVVAIGLYVQDARVRESLGNKEEESGD